MCVVFLWILQGDAEAVKELLDQGADPNLKDNAGWTPLVMLKQERTIFFLCSKNLIEFVNCKNFLSLNYNSVKNNQTLI